VRRDHTFSSSLLFFFFKLSRLKLVAVIVSVYSGDFCMNSNIRWKQRFLSFKKALLQLEGAIPVRKARGYSSF